MSRDNGLSRGLLVQEEDLVPLTVPEALLGDGDRGRLTADEFTPERMIRASSNAPAEGWRRGVYRISGGVVALAPSAAELRQRELVAQVKTPITGCRKVAFVSRKGGVGKTTTCLLAGHTFASYRGDRVVALDADPDAGTLAHRLRRETAETIASLLRDRHEIGRYADIRAYTSQAPSRLEVIAGDERRAITHAIGAIQIGRAIALLERHYNLLCLDTAAGVLGSAAQGVLDAADQLVVVSAPSLDGARAASSTLDWLEEHGLGELAAAAVAVVNGIRAARSAVDLDRIEQHFAARCRACIRIPWDPHLELGAEVAPEQLRPETRQAYLELAASIARSFTEPPPRRSDHVPPHQPHRRRHRRRRAAGPERAAR